MNIPRFIGIFYQIGQYATQHQLGVHGVTIEIKMRQKIHFAKLLVPYVII
jgi:hypothetical protein